MSHRYLRSFSLTRLEQHCARLTDTNKLDVLCAQGRLICRAVVRPLRKGQYLLDWRAIILDQSEKNTQQDHYIVRPKTSWLVASRSALQQHRSE